MTVRPEHPNAAGTNKTTLKMTYEYYEGSKKELKNSLKEIKGKAKKKLKEINKSL